MACTAGAGRPIAKARRTGGPLDLRAPAPKLQKGLLNLRRLPDATRVAIDARKFALTRGLAMSTPTCASFSAADTPFVEGIENKVRQELSSMQALLGDHSDARAFFTLSRWARLTLGRISRLVDEGAIHPSEIARLHGGTHRLFTRPLRLGVFPVAANPLHWLHVFSGLAAMARFRLDKVVYIVAGRDPRKPTLASEQVRHRMTKELLGLFFPLLEYSPIARGSASNGEENVFRILASSKAKSIHVFYIAGSDHYCSCVPPGRNPDTITKLEKGIRRRAHGFNPHRHKLSVVFLDRGGNVGNVETFLDVRWIHDLPLHTSSTRIRGALAGEQVLSELSFLPYSAYSAICAGGFYSMSLGGRRGESGSCEGVEFP